MSPHHCVVLASFHVLTLLGCLPVTLGWRHNVSFGMSIANAGRRDGVLHQHTSLRTDEVPDILLGASNSHSIGFVSCMHAWQCFQLNAFDVQDATRPFTASGNMQSTFFSVSRRGGKESCSISSSISPLNLSMFGMPRVLTCCAWHSDASPIRCHRKVEDLLKSVAFIDWDGNVVPRRLWAYSADEKVVQFETADNDIVKDANGEQSVSLPGLN